VEYGALERDTLALTPLGLAASEVRGENELWLAAALMQPCLSYLEPPQLAAAIAGLLAPETLNRSRAHCNYPPSPEVVEAVRGIEPARQQLQAIQDAAGINTDVAVDLRLSGLVEAWVRFYIQTFYSRPDNTSSNALADEAARIFHTYVNGAKIFKSLL
jgi:superfamily II RNA helicase